ncbi:MAG TPA: Ig-like domain-containing protein, partial [Pyrinomonadaceae bacterium]
SGYILGRYNTSGRKETEAAENADEGRADPTKPLTKRLASISLTPVAVTLSSAAPTQALTVTPLDANGNVLKDETGAFAPVWATSNQSVATVDQSGVVKFVAVGDCSITAYFQSVASNSCAVTCS